MEAGEELLLPEGTRLIHIGPHKTGSTAVQSMLHSARPLLAAHGVHYAGKGVRARKAGWSIGLAGRPAGSEQPPERYWERFSREVRNAGAMRVCVSNEDFGRADAAQRRRILDDLDGERAHVVAVARRLDGYLPSQWQERVKAGDTRTYDAWLRVVLDRSDPTYSWDRFNVWYAHDTTSLVANWVELVGEDRFTLVIGDENDRRHLPRTFERLLGLPDESLQPNPDRSNRGLRWGEAELVREVNIAMETAGWSRRDNRQLVRQSLIRPLTGRDATTGGPGHPPMPGWALDEVRRRSEERIEAIASMGVRVVGDPERLRVPADVSVSDADIPPPAVDQATAAAAIFAAMQVAMGGQTSDEGEPPAQT